MRRSLWIGGLLFVVAIAACVAWLVFRKGDRPGGDDSGGASTEPQARIEFPGLKITAEKEVQMTRAAGGTIELDDRTRLVIPPDALPRDAKVTLRRLANPGPEGRTMTITDVDVDGVTLEADAALTLPCPEGKKAGYRFQVRHVHDGRMVELPCRDDPARGVVEVRTRKFSPFLVLILEAAAYLAVADPFDLSWQRFNEVVAVNPVDPPLVVPFYHQGQANWCWAATAQMVLKAYGKDKGFEIWDLAHYLGKDVHSGIKLGDVIAGKLDDIFRDKAGLPTEGTKTGWFNTAELGLYIIEQLRYRRPVWINLYGENHVWVLVGFNKDNIFLHDPAELGDNSIPIPWKAFFEVCAKTVNPAKAFGAISTLTVQRPLPDPQPVTVSVLPAGLKFTHPKPSWLNINQDLLFAWDGKADTGYRFDAGFGVDPQYATWSDRVFLSVFLANSATSAQQVELFASLGGSPVPVQLKQFKKLPNLPMKGLNANTVEIDPKGVGALPNLFGLTGADLRGALGASVAPGVHDFVVEARVGGRTMDQVTIRVRVGPGQPQNVKLTENGRTVQWDAVAHADKYIVCKVRAGQFAKEMGVNFKEGLVGETGATKLSIPEATAQDKTWKYVVVAKHTASDTRSVPSEFAKVMAGGINLAAIVKAVGEENGWGKKGSLGSQEDEDKRGFYFRPINNIGGEESLEIRRSDPKVIDESFDVYVKNGGTISVKFEGADRAIDDFAVNSNIHARRGSYHLVVHGLSNKKDATALMNALIKKLIEAGG